MSKQPIVRDQLDRKVYDRLHKDIVSGAMVSGMPLVEARIAEELGVSKTPVREALIRLQRDGLVDIAPYRGARVIAPSERDVREILELRLCIESYIVRQLARTRPPETLARLEESIEKTRGAVRADAEPRIAAGLNEFSDILAQSCGNSRMAKVLADSRSILHLIGSASMRAAGRVERSIDQHEAIAAAMRAGREDDAVAATAEHIRSIERDSLQLDGVAGRRD